MFRDTLFCHPENASQHVNYHKRDQYCELLASACVGGSKESHARNLNHDANIIVCSPLCMVDPDGSKYFRVCYFDDDNIEENYLRVSATGELDIVNKDDFTPIDKKFDLNFENNKLKMHPIVQCYATDFRHYDFK